MSLRSILSRYTLVNGFGLSFIVFAAISLSARDANAETVSASTSGRSFAGDITSFTLNQFLQIEEVVEESKSFNVEDIENTEEYDLFDPALGTLESVEITLTGTMRTTWETTTLRCTTFLSIGTCTKSVRMTATAETGLSLSNWSPYRPVITPTNSPVDIRGAIRSVNGTLADNETERTNTVDQTVLFTSAEDLAAFTGTDTFSISAATQLLGVSTIKCVATGGTIVTRSTINSCSGGSAFDTSLDYNVSVTYTFTPNSSPVANAGPDQTVEATSSDGALVTLNGGGSSDADGDALTYAWNSLIGTYSGESVNVSLPLGTTLVTLDVSDGRVSSSDSVSITVADSTAPVIVAPANVTVVTSVTPVAVELGTATATDAVDGSLTPSNNLSGPFETGDTIVTWSATDAAGNTGSATQTVTVLFDTDNDGTPDISDPDIDDDGIPNEQDPDKFVVNMAPMVANQSLQTDEDTAIALTLQHTDTDGPTPISITVQQQPAYGTLSGTGVNLHYTPDDNFFGADSFTFTIGDGYLESELGQIDITVVAVNDVPELTVPDSPVFVQYSDSPELLVLNATDIDSDALDFTVTGLPEGLYVGEKTCSTSDGGRLNCQQSIDGPVTAAPGIYTIDVSVSDSDDNVSTSMEIHVEPEDAVATYTGATLVTSQEDGSYALTLRATLLDISAVPGDELTDAEPGDISNALVSFVDGEGEPLCIVPLITELIAGDSTIGSASCVAEGYLGDADSAVVEVSIVVEDYYTDNADNQALVTVTRAGDSKLTGGGALVLTNSAGIYTASSEEPVIFGFNAKVKLKNNRFHYDGHANFIIRTADDRKYQIKSTTVETIGFNVDGSEPEYGQLQSKATLSDITSEDEAIPLGDNLTLVLSMTDNGEPGRADSLAITLWGDDGVLLFSTHWDGSQTLEKTIDRGNLQVR